MTWLQQGAPHRHMRQFLDSYFWIDSSLIGPQIIDLGPSSLLWLAYAHRFTCNDLCNFRVWVVQITCNNGALRADNHARRLQPNLGPMRAVVALRSGMAIWINIQRIIGTRLHTGLTTNTAAGVEVDNAILALK